MPLYDVKCSECSEVDVISKRMSEDYPPCSSCGGKLERYFPPENTTGIVYKGTGWAGKEIRGDRHRK